MNIDIISGGVLSYFQKEKKHGSMDLPQSGTATAADQVMQHWNTEFYLVQVLGRIVLCL